MSKRWFFVLKDGLEPSETFGPATSTRGEAAAVVDAMREHPDLADPDGSACLYHIEIHGNGIPHVGTYSRKFMNRCRAQQRRKRERAGR